MTMDKIFISGLEIQALIGIYPEERELPQPLLLDIELYTDTRKAAASEAIADTVDYDALAKRLQQLAAETKFLLLEALAEYLAQRVLQEFAVQGLRLRIHKPMAIKNALAGVKGVGIEVVRDKPCTPSPATGV